MRYLKSLNSFINEAQFFGAIDPEEARRITGLQGEWFDRVMRSVKYDREEDIRGYLLDLTDSKWIERPVKIGLCSDDFELDTNKQTYKNKPLYKSYTFTFTNRTDHSIDRTIEVMNTMTAAMERLKDAGYNFRLLDFILGKSQKLRSTSYNEKIQIEIYHKDDIVPLNIIFLKKKSSVPSSTGNKVIKKKKMLKTLHPPCKIQPAKAKQPARPLEQKTQPNPDQKQIKPEEPKAPDTGRHIF